MKGFGDYLDLEIDSPGAITRSETPKQFLELMVSFARVVKTAVDLWDMKCESE